MLFGDCIGVAAADDLDEYNNETTKINKEWKTGASAFGNVVIALVLEFIVWGLSNLKSLDSSPDGEGTAGGCRNAPGSR